MKTLDAAQLEAFDTEYVTEPRWLLFKSHLDRHFPEGDFSFLDVGGGNGVFADRLLAGYPAARGTVLDSAPSLLARNTPHERKTLQAQSAANLSHLEERFDLVCFNWVLHHLIGNSRKESIDHVRATLMSAVGLLTPRGCIAVFENFYQGYLVDDLPGSLIFNLTSSKALARVTKAMGANTAGLGVCFQSKRGWLDTIARAKLMPIGIELDQRWPIPWQWRVGLAVREVRIGLIWTRPASAEPAMRQR